MQTNQSQLAISAFGAKDRIFSAIVFLAVMVSIYLTSLYNYLLFHSLVELFSVVIAFSVFTIAWNSRSYLANPYLLIIGISCLFIGFLDLLHTLGYKGMAIFTDYDFYANQLWVAARFMEAVTLLGAFAYLKRGKPDAIKLVVGYTLATGLVVASIFWWKVFPECFIAGKGQTPFKIYSEYFICTILIISLWMLKRLKNEFDPKVYRLLGLSIVTTIISELAFTIYINNYGISNLVGHYFKIFTFILIYSAVIKTSLNEPYNMIFRELKQANVLLANEIEARKEAELQKEQVISELQKVIDEINTLKGIIPICSYCKRIRNDAGSWEQLEAFISSHSEADFSHGICPNCIETNFPEYATKKANTDKSD